MKFRIRVLLGDEDARGFAKDPGYEVEVDHPTELELHPSDLANDYGDPLPVGAQLIIERTS